MTYNLRLEITSDESDERQFVQCPVSPRDLVDAAAIASFMETSVAVALTHLNNALGFQTLASQEICDELGIELVELSPADYWAFARATTQRLPLDYQFPPIPYCLGVFKGVAVTLNQNVAPDPERVRVLLERLG